MLYQVSRICIYRHSFSCIPKLTKTFRTTPPPPPPPTTTIMIMCRKSKTRSIYTKQMNSILFWERNVLAIVCVCVLQSRNEEIEKEICLHCVCMRFVNSLIFHYNGILFILSIQYLEQMPLFLFDGFFMLLTFSIRSHFSVCSISESQNECDRMLQAIAFRSFRCVTFVFKRDYFQIEIRKKKRHTNVPIALDLARNRVQFHGNCFSISQ